MVMALLFGMMVKYMKETFWTQWWMEMEECIIQAIK